MKSDMYKPSGELQGDDKAMPDRGTATGAVMNSQDLGMSTDADAINRIGSIRGSTKSDPMDEGDIDTMPDAD